MTMEKIAANVFIQTVYPDVNVGCIIPDRRLPDHRHGHGVADKGAICVDTPLLPGEAQRWRAQIRSLGAEPVRFVVYTSAHQERILGTQYLIDIPFFPPIKRSSRRGRSPVRRFAPLALPKQGQGHAASTASSVVAHRSAWEQVQECRNGSFKQAMIDALGERDPDITNLRVIPPHITCDDSLKLHVGAETVTILAASEGMLWVWLPEQGVLFVGDTVIVGAHPPLGVTDIRGWLASLERLRQDSRFRDAVIVPGRGPVCDVSATQPLTEYLLMVHEKTQQVYQAGRPKADLNRVAGELLLLYPIADEQREQIQRQIKQGLDDLYDELKAADVASA